MIKYKTMTVGEIKKKLSGYPDGMVVLATSGGVYTELNSENFEIYGVDWVRPKGMQKCLMIDVEMPL